MEKCGFFDANLSGDDYDRVYLAEHFAAYFASFIGNGVFAEHSDGLQVMSLPAPKMQVSIQSGQGFINGYWYENTNELYKSIDVSDGVLNRIDSIILRFGTAERNIWVDVKKGIPAVNPVAPSVTRNADYYDLQLATVSIPAGSLDITQAQITDTRLNNDVCGWVTGVVQQIDTTTLFNQFEAYFEEFQDFYEAEYSTWTEQQKAAYILWITQQKAEYETWIDNAETDMTEWTDEQKAEYNTWYSSHTASWKAQFDTWFTNIKGQLSEDAAGNLQNEVDTLEEEIEGYTSAETTFSDNGKLITQVLENGNKILTKIISNLEIIQEWYNSDNVKIKEKKITFSQDGTSIIETKEVI